MPRAAYFTGGIDIHDIDYGGETLYAVNTSFSCLIKIDDNYSFTPIWKPPFITKLVSEDRCHLNGMALENEVPKYATAFNRGNSFQSWREEVTTGGILMDVQSNELVAEGLAMPHSPRIFDNQLYILLSATGDLIKTGAQVGFIQYHTSVEEIYDVQILPGVIRPGMDVKTGKYDVVTKLNGFVRGLAKYGDYVFVGLSRLRKNSSTFAKLSIADKANQAGIAIIHLPTGAQVGFIQYHTSVEEIYDVQILPGVIRPGILNTLKPEYKMGLSTPETTYWARKAPE